MLRCGFGYKPRMIHNPYISAKLHWQREMERDFANVEIEIRLEMPNDPLLDAWSKPIIEEPANDDGILRFLNPQAGRCFSQAGRMASLQAHECKYA